MSAFARPRSARGAPAWGARLSEQQVMSLQSFPEERALRAALFSTLHTQTHTKTISISGFSSFLLLLKKSVRKRVAAPPANHSNVFLHSLKAFFFLFLRVPRAQAPPKALRLLSFFSQKEHIAQGPPTRSPASPHLNAPSNLSQTQSESIVRHSNVFFLARARLNRTRDPCSDG